MAPAVPEIAVLGDIDDMGDAIPLPEQAPAGLQCRHRRALRADCNPVEPCRRGGGQIAGMSDLQRMGKKAALQDLAHLWWNRSAEDVGPEPGKCRAVKGRKLGHLGHDATLPGLSKVPYEPAPEALVETGATASPTSDVIPAVATGGVSGLLAF